MRYKNPVFFGSREELAEFAADIVVSDFQRATEGSHTSGIFRLGVATGSSPRAFYKELVKRKELAQFKPTDDNIKLIQLDNYVLPPYHPSGYDTEIDELLVRPLGLSRQRVLTVPPTVELERTLKEFESFLKQHPIDVQMLGIGVDAHLAFILPRSSIKSDYSIEEFLKEKTHLVTLNESTRLANSRFFDNDIQAVPKQAVTRGARSILSSKQNIVFVNDYQKGLAVTAALFGNVCTEVPASMLQTHPNTIWLLEPELAPIFDKRKYSNLHYDIPDVSRLSDYFDR